MTPTKLLIGQIVIVFAIVIAGIWLATEWAAWRLAWQPELGLPWFVLGHWPIYRPWSIVPWWFHFDAYAPRVFGRAGMIAGASGFAGCGAAVAGSLWRARQAGNVTTYGSARWADHKDLARAGLLDDAGVFLGRSEGAYLRHDGPEHILAFAPTRSGRPASPRIVTAPTSRRPQLAWPTTPACRRSVARRPRAPFVLDSGALAAMPCCCGTSRRCAE